MPRLSDLAPLVLCAALAPAPLLAQATAPQAGVDYAGFVDLAGELGQYREARLLSWHEWNTRSQLPGAIVLDTRSTAAFAQGHIRGAVNLPFSEFTAERLAEVVPDPERAIFIYCNNNFADDAPPVQLKRLELALNIPTFINLYGYGYRNIFELGDVVTMESVDWVSLGG